MGVSLSRGVSVRGGLCLGGLCPGGSLPRGLCPWGAGGLCQGDLPVRLRADGTHPTGRHACFVNYFKSCVGGVELKT